MAASLPQILKPAPNQSSLHNKDIKTFLTLCLTWSPTDMPYYPHDKLVKRVVASPTVIPPHPEASPSPGPIVLFPGEHPSDLNGAPFTTLPASVLSSLPPNALPTPNPAVPSAAPPRPPGQASSSTKSASFASLTSTQQSATTPIPSPSATPAANNISSQPTGTSSTTIGVVVSLILVVVLGIIAYAIYRFHLKNLKGKSDPVKLRPLVAGKMISRPTLIPMQGSQMPLDEKPDKFRRTRASLGQHFKRDPKVLPPKTISPTTYSKSNYKQTTDHRQTVNLGKHDTTDILDSYGSEFSYPSTYVNHTDFDWPIFKPSPAQIPRLYNGPDTYPTSPSEVKKFSPISSPKALNPRRLQNVPFKLPKHSSVHLSGKGLGE